ncbi:unnamed protein product [Peniophora sp. CBMAI 1063]|nr:unnamed protein product [Peniophora sp. CBMAI 1063]
MFKRSGRGHEPGGIAATPLGACAVRCPACPDLDMNVPFGWATKPFQWLYRVILSLDANFRLNNKLTRSKVHDEHHDPNLSEGCAYMPPRKEYNDYLDMMEKKAGIIEEPSDCSQFGALALANTKGGKGMRSTGVAGCFCARHEFVQPLGLAVLRKGERYMTMDWVFCGALSFLRCVEITVSYDIACQWSKRLHERLRDMAPGCKVSPGVTEFFKHHVNGTITYVVPKFHLYAHKLFCQLRYAFGWLFGTGLTDGEACERAWSGANPAASSLREMGSGGMSDTMDDMCSAWNWRKLCGIADLLCDRMERCLRDALVQTRIFTEFTEAIEAEEPKRVHEARVALRTWDQDPVKKMGTACPYYIEDTALSALEIELQTAQVQSLASDPSLRLDAQEGAALVDHIRRGLKIEDDRSRFSSRYPTSDGTTAQVTARTYAMKQHVHEILRFRDEQKDLTPRVYALLTPNERDPEPHEALTVPLYLPSSPPDNDNPSGSDAARAIEANLRRISMLLELERLRHHLRLKGCLNRVKIANVTGQHNNTRAREAQDSLQAEINVAADSYRRHRRAYFALLGKGDWEKSLRKLKTKDCRGLGDRLIEQIENMSLKSAREFLAGRREADSSGETRYELSWIWFNRSEELGMKITDELMVEWCKSRARAQHYVQEICLLDEEMRRVTQHSESMAKIWEIRSNPEERMDFGDAHAYAVDKGWEDGARAYALKQSLLRRSQAAKWRAQFSELRASAGRFLALHTDEGLSLESPEA